MSCLLSLQLSAMLSIRWVYTPISCSVILISIVLLIIPGYFFIVVAPARRCPVPFFIFCLNPQLASRNVRDMYWTCRLRQDYPPVVRFILFCQILRQDMCAHIYGTAAVCLSVMLSCLSCQKECTQIHALSDSPLEVCILTRRVATLCPWFHCFEFWWSASSNTTGTGGWCGYHVPGPTRLGKMSKPLLSSRVRFWKPCSGNSGDCHV